MPIKISFSTNGWINSNQEISSDFATLFGAAKDLGYDGIELHNISDDALSASGAPFSDEYISSSARKIASAKLSISCVDSISNIADEKNADEAFEEISKCISFASKVRSPYVRIRAAVDTPDSDGFDRAVNALIKRVLPVAENAKVALLVETSGVYADTARLAALLNTYTSDSLAALWDVTYPYRVCGEEADTTVKNLGAYIRHVHLKDSVVEGSKIRFCLLGEGDMPIGDVMLALSSLDYDRFISFECPPAHLNFIDSPHIVLPHYINYMSRYTSRASTEQKLYYNRSKTGRFVWKKNSLVDLTFSQVLDKMVELFPDQYAFKYTTLDYTRTYAQFRDDVDTFARTLIALGVKKGDKVAVWATNVPQWFITFWASVKIGAVLVTVNTANKIHEAEYLFRQSDTHTLVLTRGWRDADYKEIMEELCPELADTVPGSPLHSSRLPFLRNIITVGFKMKGALTWESSLELASKIPCEEVGRRAAAVDVHDVANMQYTSGTTGFPKGVMLTHYNIVNNGKLIGDSMDLSTCDRMMIQVPMFHCFGMVLSMTSTMTHGGTLCPMPYFSPKSSLACINQEKITCFNGVPTMFIAMFNHDDFAKTDFSYMRTGIMAGSNCPADLMKRAAAEMNMREIVSVYGQTEASPGCTMGRVDDSLEARTETVGSAFPNVECKIIDPETGEDCPDGVNGEFVARGYNIMKGYYKMPKATAAAIDADGWLHTGDLACRDSDGNYRITGRLKDMIIRGGENIYPREIEEFILTHESVKDVQVIGVPDKRYGEEIMAQVILKEGESLTVEELKVYITEHLARHKVPRYIEFVADFPMNAAGKILKYKMREDAVKRLGL